jgi:hypothetical protein
MKHFTQLFVATLLSIFITSAVAQETKDAKSEKKDNQNQDQFFKSDKESKLYNYYERKKISQPLQPSYDTDSMPFQKGNKKKEEQQKAFLNNQYRFPAKPKDKWENRFEFWISFSFGRCESLSTKTRSKLWSGLECEKIIRVRTFLANGI